MANPCKLVECDFGKCDISNHKGCCNRCPKFLSCNINHLCSYTKEERDEKVKERNALIEKEKGMEFVKAMTEKEKDLLYDLIAYTDVTNIPMEVLLFKQQLEKELEDN